MRFTRIRIERFGPLIDLDTGEGAPLPRIVAVLGPNEAGKSAFHQALTALLFGFYPANRDQNPFTPWDGGSAEIAAEIELAEGGSWEVNRRLLATPRGELIRNGTVDNLDNRNLPVSPHVDRHLYPQLYGITLSELAELDQAGWESVQDHLVVGMGSQDLRAPRGVVERLTREANQLWRADRRTSRYRELRDQVAQWRELRKEAEDRDRRGRELLRRRVELSAGLEDLRRKRRAADRRLARLRELLPLRGMLARIEELEATVGEPSELEALPGDPRARLEELDERLREVDEQGERLRASLDEARETVEAFSAEDRALVEIASEVEALTDRAPLFQEKAARGGALEHELRQLERRIRESAGSVLEDVPETGADLERLQARFAALPLTDLREKVEALEDARRRQEGLEDRLDSIRRNPPPPPPRLPLWAFALGIAGLAALIGGLAGMGTAVTVIGLVLLLAGGGGLARGWARLTAAREVGEARRRDAEEVELRRAELSARTDRIGTEVTELLAPLGVRDSALSRTPSSMARALEELGSFLREHEDRGRTFAALTEEERRLTEETASLGDRLGLDLPQDLHLALPVLARRLRDAREVASGAEASRREIERLEGELARVGKTRSRLDGEREHLVRAIRRAGGDTDEPSLQRVEERLRSRELRERLVEELERESGSLRELRQRIEEAELEGEDWSDPRARLHEGEDTLAELDDELEGLRDELSKLEREEGTLQNQDTVDVVEGRIQVIEEEIEAVRRKRDRLLVLARLLDRAEHRFRTEHQPDLVRRAEAHMERITAGRYRRLLLGSDGETRAFQLDAGHLPHPFPLIPPLSTGTREQVYFALRLAIVDHLDGSGEPLPLLLDEILVNWDPERRSRALDVLRDISKRRQVFLFTCHPHIAREAAGAEGRVLDLGSAPLPPAGTEDPA